MSYKMSLSSFRKHHYELRLLHAFGFNQRLELVQGDDPLVDPFGGFSHICSVIFPICVRRFFPIRLSATVVLWMTSCVSCQILSASPYFMVSMTTILYIIMLIAS